MSTKPDDKGSLVLSRKPGESFFIGEDVEVKVVRIEGCTARLLISAPKSVVILRAELKKPK